MNDHDVAALREHLAERDEGCPGCGYNLRGVVGGSCPECGEVLALGLTKSTEARAWLWFLSLAFGWIVLAAGIIAVDLGVGAYNLADYPRRAAALGQSISFQSGNATPTPTGGGSLTLTQGSFRAAATPATAPVPLAWSSVGVSQWIELGLAAAIAAAAVVGFVLTRLWFRRSCLLVGCKRLVVAAGLLWLLWGGWYIWTGVRFVIQSW